MINRIKYVIFWLSLFSASPSFAGTSSITSITLHISDLYQDDNPSLSFEMSETQSLEDLYQKVAEAKGIGADTFDLYFDGKLQNNDADTRIRMTELTDQSILTLTIKKTAMERIGDQIAGYIAYKTDGIHDSESLTQHLCALILAMYAFNDTAWEVARDAARDAASDVAGKLLSDDAGFVTNDDRRTVASNNAYFAATQQTICIAAVDAASNVAWKVARDAFCSAAVNAASDAAVSAAKGARQSIATKVVSSLTGENLSNSQRIGIRAYQLAQKEAFSENGKFNEIFSAAFDAALRKIEEEFSSYTFRSRICMSQNSWKDFKEEYFGDLKPEARIYLTPWIAELDKLCERIQSLSAAS